MIELDSEVMINPELANNPAILEPMVGILRTISTDEEEETAEVEIDDEFYYVNLNSLTKHKP